VSSHEPATTLELGLLAKRAGYPWIIDLGDPVLAPYTPRRWRARAYRLEHEACGGADAVVLTSTSAADLMRNRHGVPDHKLHVITQGFDDRLPAVPAAYAESDALELFYSGSLYAFRRIDRLLDAVRSASGVCLTIASSHFPDALAQAIASSPQQVRYIGFLPHDQVLRYQRQADVLVNLSNEDPCQVPGKVFEYLGAGRPILHVCEHPAYDEAAAVIAQMCVGMAVENTVEAIAAALRVLAADRRAGRSFEVPQVAIERYGWSALGERYSALLQQVVA
jgi:glycosyltransferase involved in cell wall biosynthesis